MAAHENTPLARIEAHKAAIQVVLAAEEETNEAWEEANQRQFAALLEVLTAAPRNKNEAADLLAYIASSTPIAEPDDTVLEAALRFGEVSEAARQFPARIAAALRDGVDR